MSILGSVGVGGKNQYGDVKQVQQLLQRNGFPQIRDDGRMGPKTIQAIKDYQARYMTRPDGVVDVNGQTYRKLATGNTPGNAPAQSSAQQPAANNAPDTGRVTVNAGQVTFNAEGNDSPRSPYFSRQIHWPAGVSGVTIGRGYDMGGRSSASVLSDLVQVGVPRQQAETLSQGAGLTGTAAHTFVTNHRTACGVITHDAQARLFELIYPTYVTRAQNIYLTKTSAFASERTAWDSLHTAIRDITVDFVYQGLGFERVMKQCMTNNFDTLITFIETNDQVKQYEGGRQRANYLRLRRS